VPNDRGIMATVVWTEFEPDRWYGDVAGTIWFRVQPGAFGGNWILLSSLPLPFVGNNSRPTADEAKALAQSTVDALALVVA